MPDYNLLRTFCAEFFCLTGGTSWRPCVLRWPNLAAILGGRLLLSLLFAIIGLGSVGLLVGSFIATVVTRQGRGETALVGRSRCDGCRARVPAVQLIPLFSFAVQRGKTRCCEAPIDRMHPFAEASAAAIGALSGVLALPFGLAAALFGWTLLALALIDARQFTLPNSIVAMLACAGVAASLFLGSPPLVTALIGMAVGFFTLEIVRLCYRHLRGRDGIGRGDPKMFAAIGAWVGWAPLPTVLLGAALAGLGWAFVSGMFARLIGWGDRLPLGTLLALAAWPAWLWWIGFAAR